MNLNKSPEMWAKIKPDAFLTGSIVQARNVIEMAQQDIARMARQISELVAERDEQVTSAVNAGCVYGFDQGLASIEALTKIDTLATCSGVVDPNQHAAMLGNIYRIARDALRASRADHGRGE